MSLSYSEARREVRICDTPGRLMRPLLLSRRGGVPGECTSSDGGGVSGDRLLCIDAQEEATWVVGPPASELPG